MTDVHRRCGGELTRLGSMVLFSIDSTAQAFTLLQTRHGQIQSSWDDEQRTFSHVVGAFDHSHILHHFRVSLAQRRIIWSEQKAIPIRGSRTRTAQIPY